MRMVKTIPIKVEVSGFEPELREPKSLVLPLHHTSVPGCKYSKYLFLRNEALFQGLYHTGQLVRAGSALRAARSAAEELAGLVSLHPLDKPADAAGIARTSRSKSAGDDGPVRFIDLKVNGLRAYLGACLRLYGAHAVLDFV